MSSCPRQDEPDGLAAFVPQLRARAHGLIGPKLHHFVASSDLLQETLLVAVRKFAAVSGRPTRQVLAWLNQVMQHRLLWQLRKHRREMEGTVEVFPAPDPRASSHPALSRLVLEELRGELLAAIDALPESERVVIVALYKEREGTKEIAERLGKTEGAIRALHQRAVKRLRKNLEGRFP
jgi:RNA polymerase sigma factor (sigma-70 family)